METRLLHVDFVDIKARWSCMPACLLAGADNSLPFIPSSTTLNYHVPHYVGCNHDFVVEEHTATISSSSDLPSMNFDFVFSDDLLALTVPRLDLLLEDD